MFIPHRPVDRHELLRRAARARDSLRACTLCERRCGVDRLSGERAPCGLDGESWSFKRHVSFAEEPELLPSHMVYFNGCNFRCSFCVQAPTCFAPKRGERVEPAALALECEQVVSRGARTINLLGGEPSIHLHTILELAAAASRPLPLVLNSNMFMTPEVLGLLDGVVGLYLADFKFGSDACAQRIAGVRGYVGVVQRNLLAAQEQAPVLVRHLLMPGHLECCLKPVARWVKAHLPSASFTLMTGYVPAWRASRPTGGLGRGLRPDEVAQAESLVRDLGLAPCG